MDDYVIAAAVHSVEHDTVDEDHPYEGPPPDVYGRVTNPEWYIVTHDAAIALVDRLQRTYRVPRSEPAPEPELVDRLRASRAIRLDPHDSEAGSLVCTFTEFPGVILSLGGGYGPGFPSCGCDACNQDSARIVNELLATAEQLVQGGLVEGVGDHTYSFRIRGLSGTTVIADDDSRRSLPAYRAWKACLSACPNADCLRFRGAVPAFRLTRDLLFCAAPDGRMRR